MNFKVTLVAGLGVVGLMTTAVMLFGSDTHPVKDVPVPQATPQAERLAKDNDSVVEAGDSSRAKLSSVEISVHDLPAETLREIESNRTEVIGSFPTNESWQTSGLPQSVNTFDAYALAVVNDLDGGNFQDIQSSAEKGDGTSSYLMYLLHATCANSAHSESEFDRQIADINARANGIPDPSYTEFQIQQARDGYIKCDGLAPGANPTERVMLALDWLTTAAEQGHLYARIAYPVLAKGLIKAGVDVFKYPEILVDYRDRSIRYLTAALKSGHPEAFATMARTINEGSLFDRDAASVYSYFVAADMAGNGRQDIGVQLLELENELTNPEIANARSEGIRMCRKWCKQQG